MISDIKREYNRVYYAARRDVLCERQRAWRLRNLETVMAKDRNRYKSRRESILLKKRLKYPAIRESKRAYNKLYHETHVEAQRRRAQLYRKQNSETVRDRNRNYVDRNRAKVNAYQRCWSSKNRVRVREYGAKRRALELRSSHDNTAKDFFLMLENQDVMNCTYCGKLVTGCDAHVDHIVPISKGGEHSFNNLAVACQRCNQSKKDKSLEDWWKAPFGSAHLERQNIGTLI